MYFRQSSARSARSDEVGEGDLGLHHPELGEVPGGVGVLGPERRAERVDLAHGQAVGLDVELARNREVGLPAEEVLGPVNFLARVPPQVGEIEGRHPEHRSGAFGVVGRDDRRVDPEEAALVEEPVQRLGQAVAHPGDGAEGVGPGPEVGHLPEVLEAVPLGRHRVGVGVVDPAQHLDGRRLDLDRLTLPLRFHQFPGHHHGTAGGDVEHLALVVRKRRVGHGLDGVEARPVRHGEERQAAAGLGVAPGPHPALDRDGGPHRHVAAQDLAYRDVSQPSVGPSGRCGSCS